MFSCNQSITYNFDAGGSDATLFQSECSTYCPTLQNDNNTFWNATLDSLVFGQCLPGYRGNPSRLCLRSDGSRTWSQNITGVPCTAIPLGERLGMQVATLSVVFGLVVFFFVFSAIVYAATRPHLHRFQDVHPKPSLIFLIPLSWLNLYFGGAFLADLVLNQDLFGLRTVIAFVAYLFGVGFNLGGGIFIMRDFIKKHQDWLPRHLASFIFAFFFSIANVANMNLLTSRLLPLEAFNTPLSKLSMETLSDLSLGVYMFKDLPMFIIQIIEMASADFVQTDNVIALILTGLTLVFGYGLEFHRWILHREEYFHSMQRRKQSQELKRLSRLSRSTEDKSTDLNLTEEQLAQGDPVFNLAMVEVNMEEHVLHPTMLQEEYREIEKQEEAEKEVAKEKEDGEENKTPEDKKDEGETDPQGGKKSPEAEEEKKPEAKEDKKKEEEKPASKEATVKRPPPPSAAAARKATGELDVEKGGQEEEEEEEKGGKKEGGEDEDEYGIGPDGFAMKEEALTPFYWVFVYTTGIFLAPGVLFSLAFQFFTVLGAPFAVACLRRYLYIFSGDYRFEEVKQFPEIWTLNWYEQRGFYLIPVNMFAFVYVGFYFFPTVTMLGAAVLLVTLLGRLCGKRVSFSFRRYYSFVLTCLIWAYIPLWGDPPRVYPNPKMAEVPTMVMKIISVVIFLGFEFALPISDHVTDFIYAGDLVDAYQDPYLEGRETLNAWIIVAFLCAGLGLLYSLMHGAWMLFKMFVAKERVTFMQFALGDEKVEASNFHYFLQLFDSGIKSIIQLIVATSTVTYVSGISAAWIANVAFSVVRVSFGLSGFVCDIFYTKHFNARAKFVTQVWFFIFFGIVLANAAKWSIVGDFCARNRTLSSSDLVDQLTECTTLSFPFDLNSYEFGGALDFRMKSSLFQITFTNNEQLSDVSFSSYTEPLNVTLFMANNDLQSFDFSTTSGLTSFGEVILRNNTFLNSTVSFSSIRDLNGTFVVQGGSLSYLDLREVATIRGNLTVVGTDLSSLFFPKLTKLTKGASITLKDNPQLSSVDFGTLQAISPDAVVVVSNCNLTSLQFPFLQNIAGTLIVDSNPTLNGISLPSLATVSGSFIISQNPGLVALDIDSLDKASKVNLQVSGNPLLTL